MLRALRASPAPGDCRRFPRSPGRNPHSAGQAAGSRVMLERTIDDRLTKDSAEFRVVAKKEKDVREFEVVGRVPRCSLGGFGHVACRGSYVPAASARYPAHVGWRCSPVRVSRLFPIRSASLCSPLLEEECRMRVFHRYVARKFIRKASIHFVQFLSFFG